MARGFGPVPPRFDSIEVAEDWLQRMIDSGRSDSFVTSRLTMLLIRELRENTAAVKELLKAQRKGGSDGR